MMSLILNVYMHRGHVYPFHISPIKKFNLPQHRTGQYVQTKGRINFLDMAVAAILFFVKWDPKECPDKRL